MNTTEVKYEVKLEQILNKYKSKESEKSNILQEEETNKPPIGQCNTLNSLNYCLEMHKVRKNRKADFDIHSINKYNIEDDDIDKFDEILSWKDLSQEVQAQYIYEFSEILQNKYTLNIDYIIEFIYNNLNKIKYSKFEKKIEDINGMVCILENNVKILKIKQKVVQKTNSISKLRKSLKSLKS
tara:strand:+ start:164 stop:712 length:549 start_codon:yes stop_codon:yes gene_type:complete